MADELNVAPNEKETNGVQQTVNPQSPRHGHFGHSQHGDFSEMTIGQYAQAFGGALQPGAWRPYEHRKLANPAPLGLSAFALTTFVLSCINMHARGVEAPNVVVSLAFGYGGLVQLLAGMWYVTSFCVTHLT
jgi:hypothetical protein